MQKVGERAVASSSPEKCLNAIKVKFFRYRSQSQTMIQLSFDTNASSNEKLNGWKKKLCQKTCFSHEVKICREVEKEEK